MFTLYLEESLEPILLVRKATDEGIKPGQCPKPGNLKCNPKTWDAYGGYKDGCCSPTEPCSEGEGDCSNDNECLAGYVCGNKNCPWGKDYQDRADCCELASGAYRPSKLISHI